MIYVHVLEHWMCSGMVRTCGCVLPRDRPRGSATAQVNRVFNGVWSYNSLLL